MTRYILRCRGEGTKPSAAVEAIRSLPHATVIDEAGRMLLVEAPKDELTTALHTLSNWVLAEEQIYTVPDPRPHIRRAVAPLHKRT